MRCCSLLEAQASSAVPSNFARSTCHRLLNRSVAPSRTVVAINHAANGRRHHHMIICFPKLPSAVLCTVEIGPWATEQYSVSILVCNYGHLTHAAHQRFLAFMCLSFLYDVRPWIHMLYRQKYPIYRFDLRPTEAISL